MPSGFPEHVNYQHLDPKIRKAIEKRSRIGIFGVPRTRKLVLYPQRPIRALNLRVIQRSGAVFSYLYGENRIIGPQKYVKTRPEIEKYPKNWFSTHRDL